MTIESLKCLHLKNKHQFNEMEPPAKRRMCVGEKVFDLLPRIFRWDEIELDKVYKIKQFENRRALLVNSIGERFLTELPDAVVQKLSLNEDLTVYFKKYKEDVIVAFVPKKRCTFCNKYFANSSSLSTHRHKRCKRIIKQEIIDEC